MNSAFEINDNNFDEKVEFIEQKVKEVNELIEVCHTNDDKNTSTYDALNKAISFLEDSKISLENLQKRLENLEVEPIDFKT